MFIKTIKETFEINNPCFIQSKNGMYKSYSSSRTYQVIKSEDKITIIRKFHLFSDIMQANSTSGIFAKGEIEETIRGYKLHLIIQPYNFIKIGISIYQIFIIPFSLLVLVSIKFHIGIILILSILILIPILIYYFKVKTLRQNISEDIYDLEFFR